jgi:hypothetical protein
MKNTIIGDGKKNPKEAGKRPDSSNPATIKITGKEIPTKRPGGRMDQVRAV